MGGFVSDILSPVGDVLDVVGLDVFDFNDSQGEAQREALARQAANASNAYQGQILESKRQYEINKENLMPYIEAGQQSIDKQSQLVGLAGLGAMSQAQNGFYNSPGQQFLRNQADSSISRNLSSLGQSGSNRINQALEQEARGIAAQDYSNYINRLGAITQKGQASVDAMGNLGQQQANLAGNLAQQQGQAISGSILGQQQTIAQHQQGLLNLGGMGLGAAAAFFSDIELKHNISEFSDKELEECYNAVINMPLYSWQYLKETGLDQDQHIGPMYQDAPEMIKNKEIKALNFHDELMMIAGAIKYMHKRGK